MMVDIIKVKAYALIRRNREILVEPIMETDGTIVGYRVLGGTVEFQEKALDAVKREFMEELGEEIAVTDLFCVTEEIFEYDGHMGHETAFVYNADFVNKDLYKQDKITRIDTVHHIPVNAIWVEPSHIPDDMPLWPADMAERLKAS